MADDGPLRRIVAETGIDDLVEVLTDRLSGSDLTSLLMAVMRRRAVAMTPPDVLRRYTQDRFVAPGAATLTALRRVEDAFLDELPAGFEAIQLAPVVPLGTHSAVATVDQNRVVSTIRGTEVAADTTNGLALEAAVRRKELLAAQPRSAQPLRLAGVQRVLRAQQFEGDMSFSHFTIFGLVTAGRDTGNIGFETVAAAEHWAAIARAMLSLDADAVELELTDWTGGTMAPVVEAVKAALPGGVVVAEVPDRRHGAGYYQGFCALASARFSDQTVEVADGGFVDWTAQWLSNGKERLLVSGVGLDRLALVGR